MNWHGADGGFCDAVLAFPAPLHALGGVKRAANANDNLRAVGHCDVNEMHGFHSARPSHIVSLLIHNTATNGSVGASRQNRIEIASFVMCVVSVVGEMFITKACAFVKHYFTAIDPKRVAHRMTILPITLFYPAISNTYSWVMDWQALGNDWQSEKAKLPMDKPLILLTFLALLVLLSLFLIKIKK